MIVNTSGYKFVNLDNLENLREAMRALANRHNLKGTILISHEGINIALSGKHDNVAHYKEELFEHYPCFQGIFFKDSESEGLPFKKLAVKVRPEIITLGVPDIKPAEFTAPHITPTEFKAWIDEHKDFVILDTRNDYEVKLGTFDNAVDLEIENFRDMPQALTKLPEELKEKPIVMFCTGGVRCEKAGPLLINHGFKEVYQLDGGILNYFAQCGGAHYHGECFVFDDRVAIDSNLNETETKMCEVCRSTLTLAERQLPSFVRDKHCLYCV